MSRLLASHQDSYVPRPGDYQTGPGEPIRNIYTPGDDLGIIPQFSSGQVPNDLPNPLGVTSLTELLDKVIDGLIILAVPIVIIMVLWGAFLIITSAGKPEKVQQGGKAILWAAVGFGILLLSQGITDIIESLFR